MEIILLKIVNGLHIEKTAGIDVQPDGVEFNGERLTF